MLITVHKKLYFFLAVFIVFSFILSTKKHVQEVIAVAPPFEEEILPPGCEYLQVACPDSTDSGDCYEEVCITPKIERPTSTPTPTPTPLTQEEKMCNDGGGKWTDDLPNSCGDSCELLTDPNIACLTVISDGCDCGLKQCWNGTKCTDNPIPDPTPTTTSRPTNTPTPTLTPTETPKATATPIPPKEQCEPKPACLDNPPDGSPACLPPAPLGGWCQSADFNYDGVVDKNDYATMKEEFFITDKRMLKTDITKDGRVDLTDYSILVEQWHNPQKGN